jgi:hypothetical protein
LSNAFTLANVAAAGCGWAIGQPEGAGVAGNADVVTASFTLNQARTGLIDALTAYQNARVSLAHAQGVVSQIR